MKIERIVQREWSAGFYDENRRKVCCRRLSEINIRIVYFLFENLLDIHIF